MAQAAAAIVKNGDSGNGERIVKQNVQIGWQEEMVEKVSVPGT